jgi:Flp pilus assembly protein TadG
MPSLSLKPLYRRACSAEGTSMIELAIVLPFFLLLFVGAVDFGRLYYLSIEISQAAQAGALYGVQNPGDVTGMQNTSQAAATNVANLSATATYGCECSDGSSPTPSCTSPPSCTTNYVNYVDVQALASYVPIFRYPGLPPAMTISKEVRMRVGGD